MIIEYRSTVKFSEIGYGQVFELDNCIYIKAEYKAVLLKGIAGLTAINAVGLFGGVFTLVDDDEDVILYDRAKVVLQ